MGSDRVPAGARGGGGRLGDHARAAPGASPVRLRRGRGAVGSRPRRARRRRRLRAPQQHGCRDRSRSADPVKQVVVALALTALVALPLAAQAPDVAARLTGRVPPEVVSAVAGIAASAAGRGLPVEPLVQKAIEGGAKGKPADRVIAAVRALSDQLAAAAAASRRTHRPDNPGGRRAGPRPGNRSPRTPTNPEAPRRVDRVDPARSFSAWLAGRFLFLCPSPTISASHPLVRIAS